MPRTPHLSNPASTWVQAINQNPICILQQNAENGEDHTFLLGSTIKMFRFRGLHLDTHQFG